MKQKLSLERFLLVILGITFLGAHYSYGAYISTGVANALCVSLSRYKSTNKLVRRIDHEMVENVPSAWIRWTKCDSTGNPCSQFVKQESEFAGKLKIIITLKAEQNCSDDEIPHGRTISKRKLSAHSMDITSKMIALQQHAQDTQQGVIDLLKREYYTKSGNHFKSESIDQLWITNEIVVTGANLKDVQMMLEGNADVQSVREEYVFTLGEPYAIGPKLQPKNYDDIIKHHWGVAEINAPQVWEAGYNGSGVTVGIIDSGVDVSHEILVDSYRRDYSWFDPDDLTETYRWSRDHGTHVAGIAVGRKGIGVAPGATFITCLACPRTCTESAMKKCVQWMYCPTDTKGKNPDCSKRPHIVNMSMGRGQAPEQYEYQVIMGGLVDCLHSVGIIPIFAIGNTGPFCQRLGFPGVHNTGIGVGSVERLNSTDQNPVTPVEGHSFRCSRFSSQGPPFPPYNGTIKPDFSAPGTAIASSLPGGGYGYKNGTSMAAPHVAGTVALMLQKNPNLSYDEIKSILSATAIHTSTVSQLNYGCGGIPETTFPNNCVGYGVINAYKAVAKVNPKRECKHKILG